MGILDDAIREHLDLKRRHGAEDSEVKRLEDEAFGPPARPGEPDFPDSEEQAVLEEVSEPSSEEIAPESEPQAEPQAAAQAPEAVVEESPEAAGEEETALLDREEPTSPPVQDRHVPAGDPLGEEALGEQVEAPPEPPSEELLQSPEDEAAEDEPAEEPAGREFFDQELDEDLDLGELDLDLEDERGAEAEAPAEEPRADVRPEEAAPADEEQPITHMETVEHPMEDLLADEISVEEAPPEEPLPSEEPEPADDDEEPADDDEEDDVLEETPEFLRDRPEDDELWFEQGEPKDFDF